MKAAGGKWRLWLKPFCKFFKKCVLLIICVGLHLPAFAGENSSEPDYKTLCLKADEGDAESQYLLGRRFYQGTAETGLNNTKAAEWFRKAAEKEHAGAMASLGYMQVTGRGVPPDVEAGLKLLHQAAEKNEASAKNYLGRIYELGRGVKPDRFEAMDWYMKASSQGNKEAKKRLAWMRHTADAARKGTVSNEWWTVPMEDLARRAEQGDAKAEEYLGHRYMGYGGTEFDREKAVYWLEKSAAQTNQSAHYGLSQLYESGTNVLPEKAFEHVAIAANGGYRAAQRTLGEYYRDGFGTKPDRAKALHWLCLAEQAGDDLAGESLLSLVQGWATFQKSGKSRVLSEDYSSPRIDLSIRDLDNQERTVEFIKYDPETKQVKTDYRFGSSDMLPLSAFSTNSHPIIQNAFKKQVFDNDLRMEITEESLSREDCENLGHISGTRGPCRYECDGVVYRLKISNDAKGCILQDLDVETRCYYERIEQWAGKDGISGKPKKFQKHEKKSLKVTKLGLGSIYDFKTDPLVVESYDTDGGIYLSDAPTELKSKILGIRVRVSCKMADGSTIYRDFCEPSSLESKVKWD